MPESDQWPKWEIDIWRMHNWTPEITYGHCQHRMMGQLLAVAERLHSHTRTEHSRGERETVIVIGPDRTCQQLLWGSKHHWLLGATHKKICSSSRHTVWNVRWLLLQRQQAQQRWRKKRAQRRVGKIRQRRSRTKVKTPRVEVFQKERRSHVG